MKRDICDAINALSPYGEIRCGIVESEPMPLAELTLRFGLFFASDIYQVISKDQAVAVARRILHDGLAYNLELMSETEAQALAQGFFNYFNEENTTYYTNGDYYCDNSSHSWHPATTATFDTGVLVIGTSRAGCLWVEDED